MENLAAKEYAEQQASSALDWIDTIKKRITLIIIEGAHMHHLEVRKRDAYEALDHIDEILTDLFHKDRNRLMDIVGYRSRTEIPMTAGEAMLESLNRDSAKLLRSGV